MSDVRQDGLARERQAGQTGTRSPIAPRSAPNQGLSLPAIIEALQQSVRERSFAVRQQSRSDRATDSFIAGALGYAGPAMEEKARKAIFAKAGALRTAVERLDAAEDALAQAQARGVNDLARIERRVAAALAKLAAVGAAREIVQGLRGVIAAAAGGRAGFDALRERAERTMEALAAQLPVAPFVAGVPGFSLRGLALIVGNAGDLSGYPDAAGKDGTACLWKRFGLAPYQGRAPSSWRRGGGLSAAEWEEVGYKPSRAGDLYGVVTVPLFMAKAKSVYGLVYAEKKARYDQRVIETAALAPGDRDKWTPKRADMAARRAMVKCLLKNLWQAWREAAYVLDPTAALPRAEFPESPQGLASGQYALDTQQLDAARPSSPVAE